MPLVFCIRKKICYNLHVDFARPDYKNTDRVRLLRSWHAGAHHKIPVEFLSRGKRVNIFFFSTEERNGKFYKTGGWGSVAGTLLNYLGGNYRAGVADRFAPADLPYSLTYYDRDYKKDIIKKDPVTLYFTGKAYGLKEDDDRILEFVNDAMDIATNGTNEEYMSLFTGNDKEYMQMLFNIYKSTEGKEPRNMTFPSFKYSHGTRGSDEIRHIFTLDLGKEYVHFYRLKGSDHTSGEDDLQYIMMQEVDGKLWLAVKGISIPGDGKKKSKIPGNIMRLFDDKRFQENILEIWRTKSVQVQKKSKRGIASKVRNQPH